MRRIYLQPQIDDLFLASDVYDPSVPMDDQEGSRLSVRITGEGILVRVGIYTHLCYKTLTNSCNGKKI